MSVSTSHPPASKDRLPTAERLFLTEGYDAVSVRADLRGRAGTNPAAVHYHFGSKGFSSRRRCRSRRASAAAVGGGARLRRCLTRLRLRAGRRRDHPVRRDTARPRPDICRLSAPGPLRPRTSRGSLARRPGSISTGGPTTRWSRWSASLGHDQARRRWALRLRADPVALLAERPLSDDAVTSLTEFVTADSVSVPRRAKDNS